MRLFTDGWSFSAPRQNRLTEEEADELRGRYRIMHNFVLTAHKAERDVSKRRSFFPSVPTLCGTSTSSEDQCRMFVKC